MGDCFDFDFRTHRQGRDLNGRSCGIGIDKKASIDLVHGCKLCQVGHEHGGFHHMRQVQTLTFKQALQILKNALGLFFDASGYQ